MGLGSLPMKDVKGYIGTKTTVTEKTLPEYLQGYMAMHAASEAYKRKYIDSQIVAILEALGVKMFTEVIIRVHLDEHYTQGLYVEYYKDFNAPAKLIIPAHIIRADDPIEAAKRYRMESDIAFMGKQLQNMETTIGSLITEIAILKGTQKK